MFAYLLIFLGISVTTALFLYLDSRLFDKPKTRMTYIKTIAMTNIIVFSIIYLLMWLSPTKNIKDVVQAGGESAKKIVGSPTTYVTQIGEEMLSGDAPF